MPSQLLSVKYTCQDRFLICSAADWSYGQTLSMISNFHLKHWLVCIQALLGTSSTLTWWNKNTTAELGITPNEGFSWPKGRPALHLLLWNSLWDEVSDQGMKMPLDGIARCLGRTHDQDTFLSQGAGYLQCCTLGVQQIIFSICCMAGFRGSCRRGMLNALHPQYPQKCNNIIFGLFSQMTQIELIFNSSSCAHSINLSAINSWLLQN